jgi:hypothetical protein
MINWLKAKVNPVPLQYDCLLLLSNGDVHLGRPLPGMMIVGWSVVNRPDWIAPNHAGKICGENHPKAKLSDLDCDMIRELYGDPGAGLTYQQIAVKYECSKSTVRDIVKCRTRYLNSQVGNSRLENPA